MPVQTGVQFTRGEGKVPECEVPLKKCVHAGESQVFEGEEGEGQVKSEDTRHRLNCKGQAHG